MKQETLSSPEIASILENSRELDRLTFEINKLHKKLQARSTSCLHLALYRSPSGTIRLVLKNSLLEDKFWLFILEQQRSIRRLSSVLLERGNQTSIYWNSTMTRKMEPCLSGQYHFTGWFRCRMGIGNEM
ncbi:hypothetical protein F3Y22_tig00110788pilonHSYRG00515 [Hibiscus syriacus]|uniref:Uncharacterized protein n=1 Tax=Hibiscus syriacus TaxID=106335 RepID=A0A6A2ZQW0_HIBSY|nr:hypothetical protein F3Y22_tig00110788pilonHSYRG00515 [Hibiscus syriacus]